MSTARTLTVDGVEIADDGECYVIAEIGHNHQGDLDKAKALVHAAHECGADAVKFQKRSNRALYTSDYYDQPYDNEIAFFATAWDFESADFLAELDVPAFKLASGDLRNTPLQRYVAQFGKPIFLSTGGGTMEDIERAADAILPLNPQLCVLQCTAAYPAETEELNLRVIGTLRDRFPELVIGLSDHQSGISMALVAYMLGARVIEKHFTLDHAWKGTDHAFSLMPDGMRRLVRDLRRVRPAMGDGVKRPLPVEQRPLEKMGKKLVAARDLS